MRYREPLLHVFRKTLVKVLGRIMTTLPGRTGATVTLSRGYPWGGLDSLEVEQCGLLRVNGWSRDDFYPVLPGLRVAIDDKEVAALNRYRTYRQDAVTADPSRGAVSGFCMEYVFFPTTGPERSTITIELGGDEILRLRTRAPVIVPHYEGLFSERSVLHRDDIYGYGPPSRVVSGEVLALAKTLPGPIIDFGCGSGALVKALRSSGPEAFGVEINRPAILDSLWDDVRPYITLYDGRLPLPFEDQSFESGACSEVLEHVDDAEAVVTELARIIRQRLIVTVPDISAIPLLHRHNVVPWHLLESTHVNFFTQASLSNLLGRYFGSVHFARIGATMINGTRFHTSLVAIADKTR